MKTQASVNESTHPRTTRLPGNRDRTRDARTNETPVHRYHRLRCNGDRSLSMHATHHDTIVLLIIDDISTEPPPMLYTSHRRSWQAKRNSLQTGGIILLSVGDWRQLGPARGLPSPLLCQRPQKEALDAAAAERDCPAQRETLHTNAIVTRARKTIHFDG